MTLVSARRGEGGGGSGRKEASCVAGRGVRSDWTLSEKQYYPSQMVLPSPGRAWGTSSPARSPGLTREGRGLCPLRALPPWAAAGTGLGLLEQQQASPGLCPLPLCQAGGLGSLKLRGDLRQHPFQPVLSATTPYSAGFPKLVSQEASPFGRLFEQKMGRLCGSPDHICCIGHLSFL